MCAMGPCTDACRHTNGSRRNGMRVLIVTQKESLYLPDAIGSVCRGLGQDVRAVVCVPPMSTHGGPVRGTARHLALFGVANTARLVWRIARARVLDLCSRPRQDGPFHSVRSVAKAFGLAYYEAPDVKSARFAAVMDGHPCDLLVSMSCPVVIGRKVRDRFALGCINVHGAPLPRYRGLMPAFWMLCNGEKTAAATVHVLEAKIDDGEIILQRTAPIDDSDTWDSLVRKTKGLGAEALVEAVRLIAAGTAERKPNPESEATYFSFPRREDRLRFLAAGRRFF